jgi:peptide/nickel transport system substrate-binding protein
MSPLTTRPRRAALALSSLAVLALALNACSSGKVDSGKQGGTTTVSVGTSDIGTENFNPFNNTGAFMQPTQGVIYEALFYYNKAAAGDPVPVLGTGFTWDTDGTTLTVKVRQGVKFTNGAAMTSADVAYSLNLFSKNPGLNTTGVTWKATATDASTVTIVFPSTSYTVGPQVLGYVPIVPQSIWEKIPDPTTVANTDPVGTGPYMLKSFSTQSYLLTKNTGYWGTGDDAPQVDQVRYIPLSAADQATSALDAGSVDLTGNFLPTLKNIVSQHENITYTNTPQATSSLMTCENASLGCTGPQTDPAVRQALYYAMDRTQLGTQAAAGFSKPASNVLILNTVNKAQITSPDYATAPQTADVAKAKSVLEADGWKLGSNGYYAKGGKTLDLSINVVTGWTDYDTICTLLQGQYKAAGIKLTVNQVSQNAWLQAETNGKFQLSMNSVNMGVSSDPYFIYNNYLGTAATAKVGKNATTNTSRYSDPTVDAAIKQLAATNDEATKQAAYKTIQDKVATDLPYIPVYVNSALTEYNNSRATGWPKDGDFYAFPLPWNNNWGFGFILKRIRPVQ